LKNHPNLNPTNFENINEILKSCIWFEDSGNGDDGYEPCSHCQDFTLYNDQGQIEWECLRDANLFKDIEKLKPTDFRAFY
jgi:hypothetical protein